ncbi:MAG: sugar phosphate isomerase/epimerase [Clostridia bacterium]|nr:sugar phosphate isomerase/epimerase [Clostridia bacterium]
MNIKNGLAMWHYPHRSTIENVEFFTKCGFDILSLHRAQLTDSVLSADNGASLARVLKDNGRTITVHGALPISHAKEDVRDYMRNILNIADWQKRYGLIEILSFDVLDPIRDDMRGYIDFALDKVPDCKIAVEDFGLNDNELAQIEHLRGNDRFGYLIDIGHMNIRLTGKPAVDLTLFRNCGFEGELAEKPGYEQFLAAFRSKTFPIFEIHLHNNNGIDDMHYFLEDGVLDIGIIAKVLKEIKYSGIVTIESAPGYMFKCFGNEADERMIKTFRYWKEIIDSTVLN